ncbi:Cytidine deaminase [invertebrate metagenome]|uniref:Cytidine deaminase n=1 Tax=invertebrate metagenome TaxID=1711999 RepID=A0A2H9T4B7_9ZZZZ
MTPSQIEQQLQAFPTDAAAILLSLVQQKGRLDTEQITQLLSCLDLPFDQLLIQLLPVARALSLNPVSHFAVGALVEGYRENGIGPVYMGANMEQTKQPLKVSVHAEQSAVSNAWHQGETRLRRLVVNEAPCGHCRQFLNELNGINTLQITISKIGSHCVQHYSMQELLPASFGPADLKQNACLLSIPEKTTLQSDSKDELIQQAIKAARHAYAPYSDCCSAVAVRLSSGQIITGRYAENAAFNPSLTAAEAALNNWRLVQLAGNPKDQCIEDAVLVEEDGIISHRAISCDIFQQYGCRLRCFTL